MLKSVAEARNESSACTDSSAEKQSKTHGQMNDFDARMAICLEDLIVTVHSYRSLTTLFSSLTADSKSLPIELKLGLSHALIGLQHLVVLGICRLDDDKASLRYAADAIKKTDGVRYTLLMTEIGKFRTFINPLKTQHRISYIAHTGKNLDFDTLPEIPPLHQYVVEALKLYEVFAGRKADLSLSSPSGWNLDLRNWIMNYSNLPQL